MLDWLIAPAQVWSDEFYSWVKKSSRTYKDVEREVSQVPQIDHCHPICSKLFSSAKFCKLFFPNHLDVLNIIF